MHSKHYPVRDKNKNYVSGGNISGCNLKINTTSSSFIHFYISNEDQINFNNDTRMVNMII
ncbi:hypothetical protein CAP36_03300 [Chitinophagaceae bacterium IBVUCB2]|nr:hypothetical protein CAP36_03300 [Chitinophagaceae bacterium IBVUCB2]